MHFGAGNIFRGFIANLQHELLNAGEVKGGIVACDTFDFDNITLRRKLYIIKHKNSILSPIAQVFYDYAKNFYKKENR